MHDRFLNNWDVALKWYLQARDDDPVRADTYFYIGTTTPSTMLLMDNTGQHYRLKQQYVEALEWLEKAADLDIPQRSLFQWHDMYLCLVCWMGTLIRIHLSFSPNLNLGVLLLVLQNHLQLNNYGRFILSCKKYDNSINDR